MAIIGIDIFSGAGGLSLGAKLAGIDVKVAVEIDRFAAQTYKLNHPSTTVLNKDIRSIENVFNGDSSDTIILFGGPPCQGFSTSNQKTRNINNPQNWLYREFVRLAQILKPKWIVFENVKGITETENGYFAKEVLSDLERLGYCCSSMVLCASDYGIPQIRSRFFIVGSKSGIFISSPPRHKGSVTVKDAFGDLPTLENGANYDSLHYKSDDFDALPNYAKILRGGLFECSGHLVTKNSPRILQRYAYIPQGGNWKNIPDCLMDNYKDKTRCHTGIYKRLREDAPAITVGNYRKSMLIHPWDNRGLSVREAARLQSFPDWYRFCGSIGFQQQQVGNAVPPLLARQIFSAVVEAEKGNK